MRNEILNINNKETAREEEFAKMCSLEKDNFDDFKGQYDPNAQRTTSGLRGEKGYMTTGGMS